MKVIKIGGHDLDDTAFLAGLAALVKSLPSPPVLVHGGGRGTTDLIVRLGLPVRFEQGLRVTDDETLAAAIMGLVGTASTQIVAALVRAGIPALGLCGVDAGLVRVRPARPELGWVGVPTHVEAPVLSTLCGAGFVPCVAPIALGETDGHLYNVNADEVAAAVATALRAEQLLYLTNVPGLMAGGQRVMRTTPAQLEGWIADGTIRDGMIPKVRSAVDAVRMGVQEVLITSLGAPDEGTRILAA